MHVKLELTGFAAVGCWGDSAERLTMWPVPHAGRERGESSVSFGGKSEYFSTWSFRDSCEISDSG